MAHVKRIACNFLLELVEFRGSRLIETASINQASDGDARRVASDRLDVGKTHRLIDSGNSGQPVCQPIESFEKR